MIKITLFVVGAIAPICLLAVPFKELAIDTKCPQTAIGLNLSNEVQPLREPHHFKEFLEKCVQKTVLEYTIKPLTKYGDNYASALHALEVKLSKSNDSNEFETLQLAFKAMLPGAISAKQSKQFSNEEHFYSDIIPSLEQFEEAIDIPQNERIDDAFARCFCSRFSLNPDVTSVDSDALIVLENLKSINFESPDRWDRLDKDEMLAGLKTLAKIHAQLIAMRRLQPDLFFSKVHPYLQNTFDVPLVEQIFNRIDTFIATVPANLSHISPEFRNSIDNAKTHYKNFHLNTNQIPDTLYTTLYHADLWTKNFMTKKSGNADTPIQVKILDFQFCYYGSFALDLTQFIFMSGRVDDLTINLKSFIDFYIVEFVKMLQLSNCPLDDYTNEKMWNEIKDKAKISLVEIYNALVRDKITLLDRQARQIESGKASEDFYYDHPTPEMLLQRWKCVTDLYIENGFI